MAIKAALRCLFALVGDDVATVITVDIAKDPVFFNSPDTSPSFPTNIELSAEFNAAKNKPTAVANVIAINNSTRLSVDAALSGTTLTLTFASPLPSASNTFVELDLRY